MKKFLAAVALTVIFCSIAVFSACGKKNEEYSETFEGSVSEESYSTKEDAASAFVENELAGKAFYANLVDYEKTEDLNSEQIDELAIDEELKETVVAVEKVKISYTKQDIARAATPAAETENVSVFYIYIIILAPDGELVDIREYRYYVPLSENGNTLTKSYFDDLFDASKYRNCTQTYKVSAIAGIVSGGYVVKVADNKGSIVIDSSYTSANFSEGYFEQNNGSFNSYLKISGNWNRGYLEVLSIGGSNRISNISQFATMCLPNKIDYSWFEKTDYGFKMKEDLLNIYIQDALKDSGYSNADNISTSFNVYVKEGRVDKISTTIQVDLKIIKTNIQTEEMVFSDFGTTVVTKPEDLSI